MFKQSYAHSFIFLVLYFCIFIVKATVLVEEDGTLLRRIQSKYDERIFLFAAYILFWIFGCFVGTAFALQLPGDFWDDVTDMFSRPYSLASHLGYVSFTGIIVFFSLYFSIDSLLFLHFFIQGLAACFCGLIFTLVFRSATWLVALLLCLPQLLLQVLLIFLILHLSRKREGITIVTAVIFAVFSVLVFTIYAFEFEPFVSALC